MSNTDIASISDKKCERALLASIWCCGNVGLLSRLDEQDFFDLGNLVVFRELRLMAEAGEPLGDGVSAGRWFSGVAAKRRASAAGEGNLVALAFETFKEFVTSAHDDYYLKVLRRDRLRRSLQMLGVKLLEANRIEDREPTKTLEWLQSSVDRIWDKASEVFPELAETE